MNQHRPNPEDEDGSIDIELDWSDLQSSAPLSLGDEESEERITAPPPVPSEEYAAELMATAEGSWHDLPPPPSAPSFGETPTINAPPPESQRPTNHGDYAPASGLRQQGPASERAPRGDDGAIHEVRGRFALGDYSGALVMAESILDTDPRHEEAKQYAKRCRDALAELYVSRLGGMARVPQLAIPTDQLHWLALDHRAGFLLSLIDGMSSIEDILDMSGMSSLEALRTMFELMQQDVIHVA